MIVVSGLAGALVGPLPWPVATLPGFSERAAPDPDWLPDLVEAALADSGRVADGLAWQAVGVFRAGDSLSTTALAQRWDFVGPVLGIDAECAGGLVAFLLAADALVLHQCDIAVVVADHVTGGRDDSCAPLAAAAHEGGPRAGAAVLVLERAGESRRVRARVAGGAHRRLGAAAGMVGLSVTGIVDLLRLGFARASLGPADLGYWEIHALGTPVGDAVELSALCRIWDTEGNRERPTQLGSHKAGLGHLEPVSGLVSLARLLGALERGTVPPTAWRPPFSPLLRLPPSLALSNGEEVATGAVGCFALSRSGLGALVLLAHPDL